MNRDNFTFNPGEIRHANLFCGLRARAGKTFQLSAKPIWVRPLAIAIRVRQTQEAA